jgi:GMP reductase
MRIVNEVKLDFSSVLVVPKRSTLKSRKDVILEKQYSFKHSPKQFNGVPIIAANMDGVGTFDMARALSKHGCLVALTKHYSVEEYSKFYNEETQAAQKAIYSMGITGADVEKFNLVNSQIDQEKLQVVCIDVANGYNETFIDFCKRFREKNPKKTLIAGNVVTPEIVEELILNGIDIVKVGIGSGAQCLTRVQTGIGYPQLSAVIECADAAHGLGGHIVSDGGCVVPGDVAKAFGGGADFVMLGTMLAGHKEGVDIGEGDSPETIKFYGMSSESARAKHNVGDEYRSSEGRTTLIPFRGSVDKTIIDILGGLRSACSYVGAASLKELPKRTTFIRVNETHNRSYENMTVGK